MCWLHSPLPSDIFCVFWLLQEDMIWLYGVVERSQEWEVEATEGHKFKRSFHDRGGTELCINIYKVVLVDM